MVELELYPRMVMLSGEPTFSYQENNLPEASKKKLQFSRIKENLDIANFINKNFFFVNILGNKKEILRDFLVLHGIRYTKYPKASTKKEKDEKLEIIKPYIKTLYNWSESEFQKSKHLLLTFEDLNKLNKYAGFTEKECKILGIEFKTFKVEKPKIMGQKRLF